MDFHLYLDPPDINPPWRATPEYFFLWAHAWAGINELLEWEGFYDAVYCDFTTPQLLRELLTSGTRINEEWRHSDNAAATFTPLQELVLGFVYGGRRATR